MPRPSKQPQIKQDYVDYPQLTYEQLAKKNECSTRTVYRALDVKIPKKNNGKKKKVIDKINHDHFIPPERNDFIDDPDELLMSVAIRELNRANPDPRWASILINCKKENITSKSEVLDQLQKLPTKNLIEILKKQSGSNLPSEL